MFSVGVYAFLLINAYLAEQLLATDPAHLVFMPCLRSHISPRLNFLRNFVCRLITIPSIHAVIPGVHSVVDSLKLQQYRR